MPSFFATTKNIVCLTKQQSYYLKLAPKELNIIERRASKIFKMRTYLLFLFTILLLQYGNSQPCQQNTIPGSTVNVFDWRTTHFNVWIKDETNQATNSSIVSPFHSDNNSIQVNTSHFAETEFVDYEPEEGWEVLFTNFGTETIGVAEPSFALYNRYNGLVRFFMYISANGGGPEAFQDAFITTLITPTGEDAFYNSALFESQNPFHNALDNFGKKLEIATVNEYEYGYGTWIVSEWLSHYDPCTCNNAMKLSFRPKLQNITTINLDIEGESSTTPVYESGSSNNGNIRTALGGTFQTGIDISNSYKKANEVYKNYDAFLETVGDINSPDEAPTKEYKSAGILVSIIGIAQGAASGNPVAIIAVF